MVVGMEMYGKHRCYAWVVHMYGPDCVNFDSTIWWGLYFRDFLLLNCICEFLKSSSDSSFSSHVTLERFVISWFYKWAYKPKISCVFKFSSNKNTVNLEQLGFECLRFTCRWTIFYISTLPYCQCMFSSLFSW